MRSENNFNDSARIAAATQSVVNARILREVGRLVAKWKSEERSDRRAVVVTIAISALVIALLAVLLIRRQVSLYGARQPVVQPQASPTLVYSAIWQQAVAGAIEKSCTTFLPYEPQSLAFSVSITSDGKIENVVLKRSSVNPIVNDALIGILKSMAPLPPFSPAQLSQYDKLQIDVVLSVKDKKCALG